MQYKTNELLTSLEMEVRSILNKTKELKTVDAQVLNTQSSPGKWSMLQVLEHLNSYNRYYLTHIEKAIQQSGGKHLPADTFSPGLFGGYFTKMMYSQVKTTGKVANKMQAPKDHQPSASLDAAKVMSEFITGEELLLRLLAEAKQLNIKKIKVPISISKWIKLSLGDTYGFLVAHQVRHFLQIANTLKTIGAPVADAKSR
jgi:hypothetical protein